MIILLVLLSFVGVCYVFTKQKYRYWKIRDVPHPKPTLIFGNVLNMITLQRTLSHFLNNIYTSYVNCTYVGFYNFLTPAMVLRDPDIIKDFLVKNFENFAGTIIRPADPIASINPFFCEETKWKRYRKEFAPNLSNSKVKLMVDRMENVCKEMVTYLESSKLCISANELALKFTGDTVMSCAYGVVNSSFSNGYTVFSGIRDSLLVSSRVSVISHSLGMFCPNFCKLFRISYFGKQVPESFKNLIRNVVKSREESGSTHNDFVDFLKESKKKDDLTHVGHALTFFLDGYKTSAFALTYALFELGTNPSVQKDAQHEVDLIYKDFNTIYSYESLRNMVYLENVIYETLRKHPIIKFLNRSCTKDYTLPNNNGKCITIKKGTQVFVPVQAIHYDAKYYPDPNQFDPRRFDQEEKNRRTKQTFLGFGDGPRICPGQQFAVMQIKIALAAILLHFKISINEKTIIPLEEGFYHLGKFPKNGIWIDLCDRL